MDEAASASSGSSYSSGEIPERPNSWTGPPSTWQSLTAQERGLEASLVELRNKDLGIHLYNSFSLKARARKYGESKSLQSGALPSGENQEIDVHNEAPQGAEEPASKEWAPSRAWTAWPLPPDQVPRLDEHIGPDDEDELFTLRRSEKERPSRELEDVLVGTALKFAKKNWERREIASGGEIFEEENSDEEQVQVGNLKRAKRGCEYHEKTTDHSIPDGSLENVVKEPSQSPLEKPVLESVLSADDERSRDLLRPSIRHTLSQLDTILMALHHVRQTCHRYATDSESSSDSEGRARSAVSQPETIIEKRPVGRPRKFENLTSRPRPVEDHVSEAFNAGLVRAKKTHRGRPRKHYEPLVGETQEEYLIRVARLQKKSLPSFVSSGATSQERSSERSPIRGRTGPRKREKLGARDWSEVLGSAALVGLPPDVVARATQRCANLFGEGMIMRNLIETPAGAEVSHTLTAYVPEEIPDLSRESQSSPQESDEDDMNIDLEVKKPKKYLPGQDTYKCPIEKCQRHVKGFTVRSRLLRHLKTLHKMSEDEVIDILDDSKDIHGGNIPGVRGSDKRSRSRGRWTGESVAAGQESSIEKMEGEDRSLSSDS
ncbi:hypothetical protein OIDMADRAFT_105713 [Oidiodendron maius Zn]|uniref:Rrn9 domain-containing protein n=1 Tax=Oidiodendron maius (strain Zn) TaxID=913774 RepID=A0A0C3H4Q9_OIDMZ|nr:hypothetical protein OIDMADRAFT_105713 [Oidiodendron maius Zn]